MIASFVQTQRHKKNMPPCKALLNIMIYALRSMHIAGKWGHDFFLYRTYKIFTHRELICQPGYCTKVRNIQVRVLLTWELEQSQTFSIFPDRLVQQSIAGNP